MKEQEYKLQFLSLIEQELSKHPDWFKDIVFAMQHGMSEALDTEQTKNAHLAYALATAIEYGNKQSKEMLALHNTEGLKDLISFFSGTEFQKKIQELVDGDK